MASYAAPKGKTNKKGVVHQLSDLFGSLLNIQIIESVAQSCNYNVEMSSHHLLEMTSNMDDSPESPPVPISNFQEIRNTSPKAAEVKPSTQQSIPNSVSDGYLSQNLNSSPLHLPIISDKIEEQKDLEKVINGISQGYRILILMRGLPGSGKSHLAKFIIDATIGKKSYENHILSTDDFFMKNGRYKFDRTKLDEAHNWNQKRAVKAMSQGVSPVIIDNTNVKLWEMRPYAMMGVDYGYYVEILEPNTSWRFNVKELARRNTHGLSECQLEEKLGRYQKNVTGYQLLCSYNLRYTTNRPPMFRKQPPLTYGANWFSCNNLTSAVSNQQVEEAVQQNWTISTPQVNDVSGAAGSVNFMHFSEDTIAYEVDVKTPTSSPNHQASQATNGRNFLHFHEHNLVDSSFAPPVQTVVIDEDSNHANTVDDILTCSPTGENNILQPNPVTAQTITISSDESESNGSTKFSLEQSLRDVETVWGISKAALHSWDIVTPVKEEPMEPTPEVVDMEDVPVETKDSGCNTEGGDFELHKKNNLPNGYKLLYAINRNINCNTPSKNSYNIPKKLKLDKSCSATYVELQMANSSDHMEHLKSLFPSIPKKYLLEIYQKCKGDLDWAVDVLLDDNMITVTDDSDDSSITELVTVKKADDSQPLADQNLINSMISNHLCTSTTAESNCPIEVGCDRSRPESATSIQSTPKHSHSPRMELEQPGPSTSGLKPSWTAASSDAEDDTDSESEFSEPEEIVELNLGDILVNQLEDKFQNELPGYPKGFHPIVQVPLGLAKQLFAFYLESVYQQMDAQKKIFDQMVKQDEELAKQLDEHERNIQKERQEQFRDIMNEQAAQRIYEKDVTEWKSLTPDTLAMNLTRQKLFNSFPSIDRTAIDEILHAHNFDYNQTVEVLLNSVPTQYAGDILDVKKAPITQEIVKEMQEDTEAASLNTNEERLTGEEYRKEAYLYQTKRSELRQKAQRYYEQGLTEVAQYYSDLAAKQTSYLERAHSWAATSILNEHANRLQKFDTLDIHHLYTKEAKMTLDVFIDRNVNLLKTGTKQRQELFIITGRGKNSKNGISILKPVVIARLKKRKISYVQLNPGLLKITVTKNTFMTTDVP